LTTYLSTTKSHSATLRPETGIGTKSPHSHPRPASADRTALLLLHIDFPLRIPLPTELVHVGNSLLFGTTARAHNTDTLPSLPLAHRALLSSIQEFSPLYTWAFPVGRALTFQFNVEQRSIDTCYRTQNRPLSASVPELSGRPFASVKEGEKRIDIRLVLLLVCAGGENFLVT